MVRNVACSGAVKGVKDPMEVGRAEREALKAGKVREKEVVPVVRSRSVNVVRNLLVPNALQTGGPKRHVIKYQPVENDISWTEEGFVASVINGESIPLIQQHILDAGFENLEIILMGAHKFVAVFQ